MTFQKGDRVWLSSPELVKVGELCRESVVMSADEHYVYFRRDVFGVFPIKYVFPSRIYAEAAGKAHLRACMEEARKEFEEKMGKYHKLLQEER